VTPLERIAQLISEKEAVLAELRLLRDLILSDAAFGKKFQTRVDTATACGYITLRQRGRTGPQRFRG
jgi:hypothetical protein